MMNKTNYAICHIHGKFYAGYTACPICKAQKDEEVADGQS